MQDLKDLVDIVSKQRISKINVLNEMNVDTKAGKLYSLLSTNNMPSSQEVMNEIYGGVDQTENLNKLK